MRPNRAANLFESRRAIADSQQYWQDERIDLKSGIDVEGFELHVLRGITGLFESHRPVLICRFHSDALKRHGPDTPSPEL